MFNDGSAILSSEILLHRIPSSSSSSPLSLPPHIFDPDRVISFLRSLAESPHIDPIRVALQLPNEYLSFTRTLLTFLREKTAELELDVNFRFYVLGNDLPHRQIDLVAAAHIEDGRGHGLCDAVVVFGSSTRQCLHSVDCEVPLLRVLGLESTDVDCEQDEILEVLPSWCNGDGNDVIVMFEPVHALRIQRASQVFQKRGICSGVLWGQTESQFRASEVSEAENFVEFNGIWLDRTTLEDRKRLFFVGEDDTRLLHLILGLGLLQRDRVIARFCPMQNHLVLEVASLLKAKRLAQKHYYLMNLAKTSNLFGLLIGSPLHDSVQQRLLRCCRELLNRAGKKVYLFVMNKMTAPNLANFAEIDLWVMLHCACGQLVDSTDLYKPVITPYDLLGAFCQSACDSWFDSYVLESKQLVEKLESALDQPTRNEGDEGVDFSLITNRVYHTTRDSAERLTSDGRKWRGINLSIEREVGPIREGLSGIGEEYVSERTGRPDPKGLSDE